MLGKVVTLKKETYASEMNHEFGEHLPVKGQFIYLGTSSKQGYFYAYSYPGVTERPNSIHDLEVVSKCLEGREQEKYLAATPIADVYKYMDSLSTRYGRCHFGSAIYNIPFDCIEVASENLLEKYEEI